MNDNTDYTGVEKSPLVKIVELQAELDHTRTELGRWKTMAQRHNPSGCCCQIDENNGDPKMVEPCAFHAEWRDVAAKKCTHPQGYTKSVRICGLCGEQR